MTGKEQYKIHEELFYQPQADEGKLYGAAYAVHCLGSPKSR